MTEPQTVGAPARQGAVPGHVDAVVHQTAAARLTSMATEPAGRADARVRRRGRVKVVAFGGGHGLNASLKALRLVQRHVPMDITAVVTVGDDGGSSGRLRRSRDILPPGDLRQALAALADDSDTEELFQHRFAGEDDLAGHPVGNVVLCGLMELAGDPVVALDRAAAMLQCHGRVLPMARRAVGIEADVIKGNTTQVVRGQHAVAVVGGAIQDVRLTPADPEACAEALAATMAADWLIFGPGSWFTSVIPHLLVPGLARAIAASPAKRLVTLNLATDSETSGLSVSEHLAALRRYLPGPRVDVVVADGKAVGDPEPVIRAAESLGARLVLAPVAMPDGAPQHDPAALAAAFEPLFATEDPARITDDPVTRDDRTSTNATSTGATSTGATSKSATSNSATSDSATSSDATTERPTR